MTRASKKTPGTTGKHAGLAGMKDIVTQTNPLWQIMLKRLLKLSRIYGFQRIETPLVEDAAIFDAYYKDREHPVAPLPVEIAGKPMALRAALLPGVLRSYIQQKVFEEKPLSKWVYSGNVIYTTEAGQPTSDYEFGLEVLGTFNHLTEAQAIAAVWQLVQSLGVVEAVLEINTIGDAPCQGAYSEALGDFLRDKKFELCDECNEALSSRVLNVLRCNNLECQVVTAEAPTVLDFLDEETQKTFTSILEALDELQIPYQLNPLYVGAAGSSRTNIAIRYKQGEQNVVIGEGAYHDSLLKAITGKAGVTFGFCGSLGVLAQAMQLAEVQVQQDSTNEVYLVPLGELAAKKSLRLFHDLTLADVRVYDHFGTVGVKNQLKQAEESKSPIALIMGQKEAVDEMVILRDVKSGMQEIFSYDKIVIEVKKRLGK